MRNDTITLFSKPPQRESAPSAFVVSIVLHSCLFGILLLSVKRVHVVAPTIPNQAEAVRILDVQREMASLHSPPPQPVVQPVHTVHTARVRRSFRPVRRAPLPGGKLALAKLTHLTHLSTNFQTKMPAPQTLIQAQVHPTVKVMPRIPVPQAVVWTSGQTLQEKILTPAPKPLGEIAVKPSLKMPNNELRPAQVSLTSTPFETKAPMPMPGTTTPVDLAAEKPAQQILETASKEIGRNSSAQVISMSDAKLQNGEAFLPVINEVAASDAPGSPTPDEPESVADGGLGEISSNGNGTGSGQGAGKQSGRTFGVTIADGSDAGKGNNADAGVIVADGSTPGVNTGGPEFTVHTGVPAVISPELYAQRHIKLPPNGHYGMVIIGASPQENYPTTAKLWTGRLVYTVYLQSETADNWILQYSLPKTAGDSLADNIRPDAPWAYDMMRPDLGPKHGVVLVHGFVDQNGHFRKLAVAYPTEYSKAALLLQALRQWAFRPAMLQGIPVAVEILLIIPGTAH
jgi:hypothetical protein